ncbi:MAG: pilus assembly protein PilY, partial [Gammaproteobacteria bacterium]
NDSIDGTYPRFGIRQMTPANRAALASMVNGLDRIADKSNNNVIGLGFYEAYRMFAGLSSNSGYGKVKRDYTGNTANNPLAANLSYGYDTTVPGNAFANATTQTYTPAIKDSCQKNFIIYISNGKANENSTALAQAQSFLETISGVSQTSISINPSGQQANWADEYAKWFANSDILPDDPTKPYTTGRQNIITYTLEVDPLTDSSGLAMTALMKSAATNGKGKYFGVSSGANGAAIVDALKAIFQEVQAVNTVFAATTLPVSVNVRGTNLNQVYIGVFRPDAYKAPRWFGNLKMYNLGLETATNTVFLADANGNPAENASTGFISGNAKSFWTQGSTFWDFRTPEENGVGGG